MLVLENPTQCNCCSAELIYSETPLLRPPLGLRENGLYSGGGLTIELR